MSIGKIVKELIPDENNKRNSEGGFYDCGNGKILFFYSRFGGEGYADESSSGIAVIASYDTAKPFPIRELLCVRMGRRYCPFRR